MNDDSADWILRRTTDYQFVERICKLEEHQLETEELDRRIREELEDHREVLRDIQNKLAQISFAQQEHEPILKSIDRVIGAGLILRWVVLFMVGTLAAIGTAATAWDIVKKWVS